jgi:hypothetical protein
MAFGLLAGGVILAFVVVNAIRGSWEQPAVIVAIIGLVVLYRRARGRDHGVKEG